MGKTLLEDMCVSMSKDYCNDILQTWWLKPHKLFSLCSEDQKSEIKLPEGLQASFLSSSSFRWVQPVGASLQFCPISADLLLCDSPCSAALMRTPGIGSGSS